MRCGKRALVTGGAGFIGSHMVELLMESGFAVRVIDNLSGGRLENLDHLRGESSLDFEERDILSLGEQEAVFADVDLVFHLAGIGDIVPSIDRPVDYIATNVLGTVKILEASRGAGVNRVVYAASSSCYGLAKQIPTSEKAEIDLQYPYALSKYLGEQTAFHWGRVYGLEVNSIRIFNAYGPRSRTTGAYGAVFGVFLAQKLAGQPLTVVGDGNQRRDFVSVRDVVRAFLAAAETERTDEIYNVGSGGPVSVNRLVELLGCESVHVAKRPGEPDVTWANIDKIHTQLGWQPEVTFEEGVGEMLQNIDYWRDAPVWDTESISKATRAWFEVLEEKA